MDEEQKPKKYVNVNEIALECDFLKREKNSSFEIHFNEIARLRVFLFGDQTKDFGYHGRIKKVASSPAYEDMMILKEINHYMNYTTSLWQSYDELKKRYDTYLKRALDLIDNAIELLRKKESEEKSYQLKTQQPRLTFKELDELLEKKKEEGKDIIQVINGWLSGLSVQLKNGTIDKDTYNQKTITIQNYVKERSIDLQPKKIDKGNKAENLAQDTTEEEY